MAEPCEHLSASGISQRALDDPAKVWRCDGCNVLFALVKNNDGISVLWVDVEERLAQMTAALRYICQPSMGYSPISSEAPDPETWVRSGHGTAANVRLALATCIAQANAALR